MNNPNIFVFFCWGDRTRTCDTRLLMQVNTLLLVPITNWEHLNYAALPTELLPYYCFKELVQRYEKEMIYANLF